ncbi:plasmid replication protein RepC [Aestuariibius sp. HNIBRBA575]|uniref:plasmid replication protein RepC n=1 Tax=Aestuariibius sp. HNIBRBA575 TaxID=3233343 RepID=UPI0034A1876A
MTQHPTGETDPIRDQTRKSVPNGWRKASPKHAQTAHMVDRVRLNSVPKSHALIALKRVGAHLGLKPGDLMLIDTLCAFSQSQDWQSHQRPVVWPSNALLMEQTGYSLSALKRHIRRLADAGVITFKDSSNGKRWGRRDADGAIIEAYGFDLSPLSDRVPEFEDLHAEIKAERERCKHLKRQITIARRMIRSLIEDAMNKANTDAWQHLLVKFESLLAKLPRQPKGSGFLQQLLSRFADLKSRVEQAFLLENSAFKQEDIIAPPVLKSQEMDPKQSKNDPHIQTTNQLESVNSKPSQIENSGSGHVDVIGQDRKKRTAGLDLKTALRACPEFTSWAQNIGGYLNNWQDLQRIASQLAPMIGIPELAWKKAQTGLGPHAATAALMLVFDKHCTGEVASPGGYLRGMIEKSRAGELHLERSFYGRLHRQSL